jgi:hypothetical protein
VEAENMLNNEQILKSIAAKKDHVNRPDLEPLAVKKAGLKAGAGTIYMVRYAYVATASVPTRVQIQAAVNRDLGSQVALDPCHILVGDKVVVAKVYSKHPIAEYDTPKSYSAGLRAALDEQPESKLIEFGDVVRAYHLGSVVEGQVIGQAGDKLVLRVADKTAEVEPSDLINVVAAPKFAPVNSECYEYFKLLWKGDKEGEKFVEELFRMKF